MRTAFKTASRSAEELKVASEALNDAFAIVANENKTLNRKAMQHLEANKWNLAELIIQLLNDQATVSDPTPFLVDPIEGDIRNKYLWQEVRADLRVVNRSYGSKPTSQRISFTEFGISTTHRELVVAIPLEEIASGRTTAAMVSQLMAEALNRFKVSNICTAIDAGVPSATADRSGVSGWNLRYTGLTQANLDKAIDGMIDDGNTPTIFGRHAYLVGMRNFDGWNDTMTGLPDDVMSEWFRRGVIGQYHGAPIVTLKDKYSRVFGGHVLDKDKAWIAGDRKGALYMSKDVSFLDFVEIDARTATFTVGTRFEDGVLVWDPYAYRMITG